MSAARYDTVAIALHWLLAALLFGQIVLGGWMIDLPEIPPGPRAGWFDLHRSIGLTIALLALARLAWRLRHPAPALPQTLPSWQARAARINHAALYVCVFLMALSGYLSSVFSGSPVVYFGLPVPQWGRHSPSLQEFFSTVHFITMCLLAALVALHVAAALKHLLVNRDGVFQRMWPWGAPSPR